MKLGWRGRPAAVLPVGHPLGVSPQPPPALVMAHRGVRFIELRDTTATTCRAFELGVLGVASARLTPPVQLAAHP